MPTDFRNSQRMPAMSMTNKIWLAVLVAIIAGFGWFYFMPNSPTPTPAATSVTAPNPVAAPDAKTVPAPSVTSPSTNTTPAAPSTTLPAAPSTTAPNTSTPATPTTP